MSTSAQLPQPADTCSRKRHSLTIRPAAGRFGKRHMAHHVRHRRSVGQLPQEPWRAFASAFNAVFPQRPFLLEPPVHNQVRALQHHHTLLSSHLKDSQTDHHTRTKTESVSWPESPTSFARYRSLFRSPLKLRRTASSRATSPCTSFGPASLSTSSREPRNAFAMVCGLPLTRISLSRVRDMANQPHVSQRVEPCLQQTDDGQPLDTKDGVRQKVASPDIAGNEAYWAP